MNATPAGAPVRATHLLVALSLSFALEASAQIRFEPGSDLPTGRSPVQLVVNDFNGDRRPDVAVKAIQERTVHIFFGTESGALVPGPSYPQYGKIAAGDIDGDGIVDLLANDGSDASLSLQRGNGNGTFQQGFSFPRTRYCQDIELADFDADGQLDAVATRLPCVTFVRGGFLGGSPAVVPSSLPDDTRAASSLVADFDEDGAIDVLVAAEDLTVPTFPPIDFIVLTGDGAGRFEIGTRVSVSPNVYWPERLVAVDANEDGHVDVLVCNEGVFLVAGNGRGGFGPIVRVVPRAFADLTMTADFDADGRMDLMTSFDGDSCVVLRADGTGGFDPPVSIGVRGSARYADTADMDRDGHPDAVVTTSEYFLLPGGLEVHFDRTPGLCRSGTVNTGVGSARDVLFVNGSAGGVGRGVSVGSSQSLEIVVVAPPEAAEGAAPYAMYAWPGGGESAERHPLPFGIGATCRPTPLAGGAPAPSVVWNNTGRSLLGTPTRPSIPAPSVLVSRPAGLGRPARFLLQGIIADPGSAGSRRASVTNGVSVIVE